jgi:hypothetical protein
MPAVAAGGRCQEAAMHHHCQMPAVAPPATGLLLLLPLLLPLLLSPLLLLLLPLLPL